MEPSVISTYKGTILKKMRKKPGRKLGRPAGVAAKSGSARTISIEDIKAVKALTERVGGVDKLKLLADLLA
jgi:hypothetical protein